jgi:hypothetical protein
MAQYMLLVYTDDNETPDPASPEAQAAFPRWAAVTQAMKDAGVWVAGDPLQPVATATTVRERGGERLITDGPFAETRELLGGYYLLDVPDLDAALEWAAQLPNVTYGSVEVRPVMAM